MELTSIQDNYIPDEFKLEETIVGRRMLVYNYLNSKEQKITILLSSSDGRSYLDTEDAVIEEFG